MVKQITTFNSNCKQYCGHNIGSWLAATHTLIYIIPLNRSHRYIYTHKNIILKSGTFKSTKIPSGLQFHLTASILSLNNAALKHYAKRVASFIKYKIPSSYLYAFFFWLLLLLLFFGDLFVYLCEFAMENSTEKWIKEKPGNVVKKNNKHYSCNIQVE